MVKVKLTQAVGPRQAGEVIEVDSGSAASLVDRKKVAEYFDPNKHEPGVERTAPPRGVGGVAQIVDADEPAASAPAAAEPETVTGADDPDEPSMRDSLPDLRARAVAEGKATDDEAKALTKAQLVDKLTS